MNHTVNLVCAFFGGATAGSLITVAIMKKLGYIKSDEEATVSEEISSDEDESAPSTHSLDDEVIKFEIDTPSFKIDKQIDTHKTLYHTISKPTIEAVAKKYKDPSFEEHMAEREYPEEGPPYDFSIQATEDAPIDLDPYEDDPDLPPAIIEYEEVDGFGHILKELRSTRRDHLIYLIPVEYAGEIYPLESLTYYECDNILCDENDSVVDDVTGIIGEALELFGESGSEYPDLVYVRNCSMGLEYEIERVNDYYAGHVYGIKKEDIEGREAEQISKKKKMK